MPWRHARRTACTVGPNYKRPEMSPPPAYRWAAEAQAAASLADTPWFQVFDDEALHALIRESLAHNLDLRLAVARVQEARALSGVAKSFLYPEINGTAGYVGNQASRNAQPPGAAQGADRTYNNTQLGVSMSWEIDLFGRLRRNNEAAFDRYLATEEGHRAVIVALVSDVASSYFLLRELDLELEIARRTLVINDDTVKYYTTRLQGGVSNRLEAGSGRRQPRDHGGPDSRYRTADRHPGARDQRAGRPAARRDRSGPDAGWSNTSRPRSLLACRRRCSRGGRMCWQPSGCSRLRTPTSAPRRRSSTRPSA